MYINFVFPFACIEGKFKMLESLAPKRLDKYVVCGNGSLTIRYAYMIYEMEQYVGCKLHRIKCTHADSCKANTD